MFVDIFGENPQVKVLDFLIDNRDFDYSLTDIAKGSRVARPTLYKIWKDLIEMGLVKETRRVGNAKMYKLNTESELVKKLTAFDFELSKKIIRKELKKSNS